MELYRPRGTRDIPPAEKIRRDALVETLVEVFERYGFSPLETPILERWDVLAAKYAGGEEILHETYKLTDQGGRELGLRYDLTTPLARFIGMNPEIKRPFKRYHIGPVYRDGPVKQGRYREFYQCDVDTVGVRSPLADAELVWVALDVFAALDFQVEVWLNHRRLLKDLARASGVPDALADTAILTVDKLAKVGPDGVRKELAEKGVEPAAGDRWLEALDVRGTDEAILASLRELVPDSAGLADLEAVRRLLPQDGRVKLAPWLARGLGYYTGTIFEVFSQDPPFDSAVAAGGRWDELIGAFLGSEATYPASGISFGLEPIAELARREDEDALRASVAEVYLVPVGLEDERRGLEIAQRLRGAGLRVDLDLGGRGVSDNLKHADAYGIPFVVIVGPKELDQDKLTLRDMRSGEEELVPFETVVARIQEAR